LRFEPIRGPRFLTIDLDGQMLADGVVDFNDVDGAIVRVRYVASREQARRVDQHAIRQALLDAGAVHVTVQPEIVREQVARVEGMTEDIDAAKALGLWLSAQGIEEQRAEVLSSRARDYLEAAR